MTVFPCVYHLSNGIPIVVNNVNSLTCSISVNLGIGSNNESSGEYGITHFIEHMLGQGTDKYRSFSDINKYIESLGAVLDIRTGHDNVCFFGTVLAQNLDYLMSLITDELQNSLFDSDVIENEKKVILDEYRRYVSANAWYLFKTEKLLGAHNILGTPETIQSFSREQLLTYYRNHIRANNMLIVISGKISNIDVLIRKLDAFFSWIPSGTCQIVSPKIVPTVAHKTIPSARNTKIALVWGDTIKSDVLNRPAKVAMGIFRKILQDRLTHIVRERHGLSYAIQCPAMNIGNTRMHVINSETLSQNLERLVEAVACTCRDIIYDIPITESEVANAKMVVKLQNAQIMESCSKRCAFYSKYFRSYNNIYDFRTETNIINNIKPADIQVAGRKFFAGPMSILTYGPDFDGNIQDIWNKHFS